ncbi:MAG: helix-turn-helix domain-containing protein [Chloroflexi bacterium]|nr:helix-turn-helix domain-containing protein [Chloroflexota bacterium]
MKLTIAEILDLPVLAKSTLLAGHNSLERPVAGVRLWDQPEAFGDMAEKLLFWPCHHGHDLDGELVDRARAAVGRQAAALFLVEDPSLAGATIPLSTLKELEGLSLPIFRVAVREPSLEVIHHVESQLLDRVIDIIQRADLVHRELTLVAITGGDLHELTRTLADLIQNPVSVRDLQYNVLSDASGGHQVDEARRRSVELGRISPDVLQALEKYDFERRLRTEKGPFRVPAIPAVGMRARVVAPILIGDARYGYISIAECMCPLGALDLVAVEKGALVAALILSHQQELEKNERRLRSGFAYELIFGAGDRDATYLLDRRAKLLGYGNEHFAAFAIGLDTLDRLLADPLAGRRRADLLLDQLAISIEGMRPADRRQTRPLVLTERDGVIVLQPVQPEQVVGDQRRLATDVKQMAAGFRQCIERSVGDGSVWVGVGRPYARQDVRKSYREARHALTVGRSLATNVTYYEDLGLYRLLVESADPLLLHAFAQEQLGALLRHDAERKGDLLRTLRLYLECGGNKVKTAPLLPSHLNTVKYRLRQIADLTGKDPEDPEEQLSYRVALKILDLQ